MSLHCESTILIVDDDPLILQTLTIALARIGFAKILSASSVQAARRLLFEHRFTHLLCDICLPDGDGRELLRAALALNPALRAVLMSGFLYSGFMLAADLYGRVELLAKPFSPEDIYDLLGHPQTST